ncbi:MAG: hypothetical protein K6U08_03225 [Firmicutes bacterium]|nr:hypothetical protein [Bacillota bacterium]
MERRLKAKLSVVAVALLGAASVLVGGCLGNMQLARQELLAAEDTRPALAVAVLFDNSASFKDWTDTTLEEVRGLFAYLAREYPEANVSLILIASQAENLFSGPAAKLQTAYDDLRAKLQQGRSAFTNLSASVSRASFFLGEVDAKRKVCLIFSDLKHSTPTYYPNDAREVPPPKDFPWNAVRDMEVFAFYVPYEEWLLWKREVENQGLADRFRGLLPEQMKAVHVTEVVFPDESD